MNWSSGFLFKEVKPCNGMRKACQFTKRVEKHPAIHLKLKPASQSEILRLSLADSLFLSACGCRTRPLTASKQFSAGQKQKVSSSESWAQFKTHPFLASLPVWIWDFKYTEVRTNSTFKIKACMSFWLPALYFYIVLAPSCTQHISVPRFWQEFFGPLGIEVMAK